MQTNTGLDLERHLLRVLSFQENSIHQRGYILVLETTLLGSAVSAGRVITVKP